MNICRHLNLLQENGHLPTATQALAVLLLPRRDQVPLLMLDWLAFVLSKVLDRLALCLSRLKVLRDWTVTFPLPGWLTQLRSKLAEVRDGTVFSPVGALTERNWFARPLSRLLTVFKWLLLPCS